MLRSHEDEIVDALFAESVDGYSCREEREYRGICRILNNLNRALLGQVCADQIVPYPPGIPVLVPGQVITRDVTEYLAGLLRAQKRVELHGVLYDGHLPCLRLRTAGR